MARGHPCHDDIMHIKDSAKNAVYKKEGKLYLNCVYVSAGLVSIWFCDKLPTSPGCWLGHVLGKPTSF